MSVQPEERTVTAADAALLLLIEQQRQEQVALSAQAQAAFVALWPVFLSSLSAGRLAPWFDQVADVAEAFAEAGWMLSRKHYYDLRTASGITTPRPVLRPIPLDVEALWGSLRKVVVEPYLRDVREGVQPPAAQQKARGRGAQATQRHVLTPGRALVHNAVEIAAEARGAERPENVEPARPGEVDRELIGWVRTTDGDPCFFCALLASRGAVYASLQAAEFRKDGSKYHDGCACKAYPVWSDNPTLPEINYELELLWRTAQESPPDGERLDQQKPRPESTARADVAGRRARNNFRRLLAQRSRQLRRAEGLPDDTP